MNRYILITALLTISFAGLTQAAEQAPAVDSAALQKMLDSTGLSRSDIEAKVRSTLMFGGSTPVSFSGEGRVKAQFHEMSDCPLIMKQDRTYVETGWEGNESMVRIGMVARAGRNATLWSKIGFQNTFPGNFLNPKRSRDSKSGAGDTIAGLHDKLNQPAIIHEDMCAGLAVRTVPASFWLKMGAIHWTEASPLTLWKAQPRTFAWDFLPYEIEEPIARYFEYNIAKGEKTGRAAWHKKPLQGINWESINLPYNLYLNLVYGMGERWDNFEREYVDFSNDVAYAGDDKSPVKGWGVGDSYRHMFHARVAVKEAFSRMTPGLNFFGLYYDRDIINQRAGYQSFLKVFDTFPKPHTKAFFKEPKVGSFDLRGPLTDQLSLHGDIAFSVTDTNWFVADWITLYDTTVVNNEIRISKRDSSTGYHKEIARSPLRPAVYLHLENRAKVPVNADIAYISRGFYSPLSFAAPADLFFPFGANLIGPGKFIARGEASPYTQNMAGISVQVAPQISGYGHLKISYGQHAQLEKAQDLIAFPYRLNSMDLFSLFQSSYNRWGNDQVDFSIPIDNKYFKRIGDESYRTRAYGPSSVGPIGPDGGGLRSDYLGIFETFVPYENVADADSNLADTSTVFARSAFVPMHRKYTFNLELDAAYDIGPLIGYHHDFFLSLYGAVNGVSTSFVPLALNDKADNMLLWGAYLRFEPAMALTNTFYLIGLAGFENWRSQKAYGSKPDQSLASIWVPIDYRDYAFGIGFDWDMLSRVGLHGRAKWMRHEDKNWPGNSWSTPIISSEIKMWF